MPSFENPIDNSNFPVRAGFPGVVAINGAILRATSCSIKGEQSIEPVEDIDGSIDMTRYKMGNFRASGDVTFTLDKAETGGNLDTFAQLWSAAGRRTADGKFAETVDVIVHYHSGFTFAYDDMVVDRISLKISANGTLDCTASFRGRGRRQATGSDVLPNLTSASAESPLRVISYNDVTIGVEDMNGGGVNANEFNLVESFDVAIDNQSEEVYVIAGQLAPYDILPKKRKVTGSITFFGRPSTLADQAKNREDDLGINIPHVNLLLNAKIGQQPQTLVKFFGCVFQLDSTELTNGIIKTPMQFVSLGTDAGRYLAISDYGGGEWSSADQPHPFPN